MNGCAWEVKIIDSVPYVTEQRYGSSQDGQSENNNTINDNSTFHLGIRSNSKVNRQKYGAFLSALNLELDLRLADVLTERDAWCFPICSDDLPAVPFDVV